MFYTHLVYVYDVYVYIFCHYLDFTTKILFLYSQISPKVRGTICSNLPETLLIYLFFLEELISNTFPFGFKGVLVWTLNRMITLSKFSFFLSHSVFSLNAWILSWKSRLKTTSVPPGPLISWPVLLALGGFSSHKLLAVWSPCLAELCHPPQWSFFSWVFDPLVSVFSWLLWFFPAGCDVLVHLHCVIGQAGGRLGSTCCAGEQVLSLLFSSSFTNLYPEDLWYPELLFSSGNALPYGNQQACRQELAPTFWPVLQAGRPAWMKVASSRKKKENPSMFL